MDIIDLTTTASYDAKVVAGQAVYTRWALLGYDAVVHGLSNHLIWRNPTRKLIRLYEEHVSANHLEAGVGTGALLDWSRLRVASPSITLADMNPNTLRATSRRLQKKFPRQALYRWNALEPFRTDARFDSVAITYLLHCVPGTLETKGVVFSHLKAVMNPGAVLFGATVLNDVFTQGYWPAQKLAGFYNRKGMFCNEGDSLAGLDAALRKSFSSVTIEMSGCVALFVARNSQGPDAVKPS